MKTLVRWVVEFDAGFGTNKIAKDTLLELLNTSGEICLIYGITKTWHEGKYRIEKYYQSLVVKRYMKIYDSYLIKDETIIIKSHASGRGKQVSIIGLIQETMKEIMDGTFGGLFDLFGGINDAGSQTKPMMKTGLLIANEKQIKHKKVLKREPYQRVVMKIPR